MSTSSAPTAASPTSSRAADLPAFDHDAALAAIRREYPGLDGEAVILENAGGSQVPRCVADAIRDYMLESYVQTGAGYPRSDHATATIADAHAWIETFMNAGDAGRVILGSSCTQLVVNIADAHARVMQPGDEIVVFDGGHEGNIGPWTRLEHRGITIRHWPVDPATGRPRLTGEGGLESLLGPRTKLVAGLHVSNLLGAIDDVRAMIDLAHAHGAKVTVDGVAYAPHRAIDVQALGADWYVYSTYKVYGPHMAALFGTHEALAEVDPPRHFFTPRDLVPYAFQPGGVSHEGCAGLLALRGYLGRLAALDGGAPAPASGDDVDRTIVERAFAVMTALELPLQERLLGWLDADPRYEIAGPADAGLDRVPTIGFRHVRKPSKEIARAVIDRGVCLRHGHMYSQRLCVQMGMPDPEDGVVRASAVHYNTPAEIDRLIEVLDEIG